MITTATLTTGEAARLLCCPEWRLTSLFKRGLPAEPARHAGARRAGRGGPGADRGAQR